MSFLRLPVLRHGLMVRHSDILPDSEVTARIEKARRLMSEKNVEVLLAYGDPTRNGPACYLTNYPCFGLGRRATVVLGMKEGPFLFTAEPSRNLPRVRLMTTCDIEKTRQYLSMGCKRARELAGAQGRIGLVGIGNLPSGAVKDMAGLDGMETECLSQAFSALVAAKDEGSLRATGKALSLAREGLGLIEEQAASVKDLWEMAAYADYRLRLAGCEDTNILLGSSAGGRLRPGYPSRQTMLPGDTMTAYVAVQYARHWGVAGSSFTRGTGGDKLKARMDALRTMQTELAAEIRPGMKLGKIETVIRETGLRRALPLAEDVPVAAGTGFDLHEYPLRPEHTVEKDMVLQVALTADSAEGSTAMVVNMLQIKEKAGLWLAGTDGVK
ncbi:MAG: M24 family metallopeptidase [Deltaproteobacteria bacterium]|nr:M24 family metallopeptidase [Deltaproteobacteria bacterium]